MRMVPIDEGETLRLPPVMKWFGTRSERPRLMTASEADRARRRSRSCEIILFHSVLGLRPSVAQWADTIRAAGRTVHTPDVYGGATFDSYEEGMRHVEGMGGTPAIIARTKAAVAELPEDVVYAGFSNGAVSAELLAATRLKAPGAVLMHGAVPLLAFNVEAWPETVPIQVHYMIGDRFREEAHLAAFAASVRRSGAPLELFDYPGTGHLVADAGLADYDVTAAALMLDRVLAFLRRVSA